VSRGPSAIAESLVNFGSPIHISRGPVCNGPCSVDNEELRTAISWRCSTDVRLFCRKSATTDKRAVSEGCLVGYSTLVTADQSIYLCGVECALCVTVVG